MTWELTIPELSTRPNLVAEMRQKRGLRHGVFKFHSTLASIAAIPDPPIACSVLDLYYKHSKDHFRAMEGHIDDLAFSELMGFAKNVRANYLLKIRHKTTRVFLNQTYGVPR
jgi:hypothetical protein